MGKGDAFRFAGAAAGEKEDGFAVIADGGEVDAPGKESGGENGGEDAPENDLRLELGEEFLEVDDFPRVFGPGDLLEFALDESRSDGDFDFATGDGGFEGGAASGEVEVHRDFVREHGGEVGDDGTFARG